MSQVRARKTISEHRAVYIRWQWVTLLFLDKNYFSEESDYVNDKLPDENSS